MNIHNANYIGATGLYPIEEIITNTSNNLINYTINTSNNLINYTINTSNNLINYTNLTSNNITSYYNNLLNTTLPTNNITTNKETIIGNNYAWNETILEPLNHLSTISQVQDNVLPQELDTSNYRYYYFDNNQLKEARTKTTITSYPNGTIAPNYVSYISYYELYKKWFGYVGWVNNGFGTGGIQMITNDTSQNSIINPPINISLLIQFPDDLFLPWVGTEAQTPVIEIKYQNRKTTRIVFGVRPKIVNGFETKERFVRVQYAAYNDVDNNNQGESIWRTSVNWGYNDTYILPSTMTFEEYHFWSFNMLRDRFWIYMDGNLVWTSSINDTYYTNFYFAVNNLYLRDSYSGLDDTHYRYQFADVYYFKRHLTATEIQSLSRYHMSQLNNSLRVYGTLEVDKIICNSIVDYDYTDKQFKKLTYEISQTSNLQYELDHKEPLLNLTPDRVIISDPNSTRGALTTTSLTSNEIEDIKKAIIAYNPILNFLATEFSDEITDFIQANPNLVTLGVSATSAGAGMLAGGSAQISAERRIPKAYIEDFQNNGGDLRIYYPNLLNSSGGRIYITETFKDNYALFRKDELQGFPDNIKNINTGSVKIGNVSGYEDNCKFQVIGGNTKVSDILTIQKSSQYVNTYFYNTTSRLELQSGIYNDLDNNCSITATGLNHNYANNLSINADGNIYLQTYDTGTTSFSPKLTILNNGNVGIGTSTNITNKLQVNGTVSATTLTGAYNPTGLSSAVPVNKGGTNKTGITANRLLGCITTDTVEEITLGTNLSFSGSTLNATGGGTDTRWTTVNTNDIYLTNTAGQLGIGTNAPLEELHIHKSTAIDARVRFTNANTLTTGAPTATDGSVIGIDATANLEIRNYENLPIIFYTNNTEKVRIQADGNVGIGTNNAGTNKLQVNGTIAATTLTGAYNPTGLSSAVPVNKGGTNKTGITANRLLGCITTDTVEEITLGTNLSFSGSTLNATGGGTDTRWTTVNTNDIAFTSGNLTIGANLTPINTLHLHKTATGQNIGIRLTDGSTGALTTDGSMILKEASTNNLLIFNYENNTAPSQGDIHLGTNGLYTMTIKNSGNVGIGNSNPTINFSVGGTNTNHNIGRAIINVNNQHNADKRDTLSIGRWDGTAAANEFTGMRCVVATGASTGEANDNQSYITFNTWGNSIASSREVMRINQRGNVGIGTTNPQSVLELYSTTAATPRLILSGQEFFQAGNTSTSGIAFVCGVNRTTNRQLWICDSARLTKNSTNPVIRILNTGIDAIATDGATKLDMNLGGVITITAGNKVGIGTATPYANASALEVYGGGTIAFFTNPTAGNSAYIGFRNTGNSTISYIGLDGTGFAGGTGTGNWETGSLLLGTWTNNSVIFAQNAVERMRINTNGDISLSQNLILSTANSRGIGWSGTNTNLGYASAAGAYSTSAIAGDIVLRADTGKRVILQQGAGIYGLMVDNLWTYYNTSLLLYNGNQIQLQNGTDYRYYMNVYGNEGDGDECNFVWFIWEIATSSWKVCCRIEDDRSWGAAVNPNFSGANFTGQHRSISDDKRIYSSNYIGYIVSSEGKYKNLGSVYGKNNMKQNITVNDALPYVSLSTKAYDKSCFGVISDRFEEEDPEQSRFTHGRFVSYFKRDKTDNRCIINGCGEGSLWCSDYNGTLENGDYITTSPISGIGMKQDDDLLHTYTVAKITMDCDFNPQLIPVEVIKQQEYSYWGTSNIDFGNGSNIDVPKYYTNSSNVLDSEGNPVYEYKRDENNEIVYDFEYDMKYITLDGNIVDKEYYLNNSNVYRMAFVGAVYKCS